MSHFYKLLSGTLLILIFHCRKYYNKIIILYYNKYMLCYAVFIITYYNKYILCYAIFIITL